MKPGVFNPYELIVLFRQFSSLVIFIDPSDLEFDSICLPKLPPMLYFPGA